MRSLLLVAHLVLLLLLPGCGKDAAPPTAPDAIAPAAPPAPAPAPTGQAGCARTTVGFTPMTDLGAAMYQGERGGLYPGGVNSRPAGHDATGLAIARSIGPFDGSGRPAADGRYVFLSIGMSNTTQEFRVFKPLADADSEKDPRLVIVDGAQGGQAASDWADPGCGCWAQVDQRLARAGVSNQQVAIAWIKLADRTPTQGWPQASQLFKDRLATIIRMAKSRYPNLRMAYLSSRIYAGYATTTLNPEPYAYESGYAVRWVIADQLNGAPGLAYSPDGSGVAPWLAWGPYLWADGVTPRSDGLSWSCSDFQSDGTHPSESGERTVANMLLAFLKSDNTARAWFAR